MLIFKMRKLKNFLKHILIGFYQQKVFYLCSASNKNSEIKFLLEIELAIKHIAIRFFGSIKSTLLDLGKNLGKS